MADFGLLLEAERRGILPPEKQSLLAEARKRGLVPGAPAAASTAAAPEVPQPKLFDETLGRFAPSVGPAARMLVNAPGAAIRVVGNILSAVTHPWDTGGALVAGAEGALYKALPKGLIDVLASPERQQYVANVANSMGGHFAERYGSSDAITKTLEEDPAGAAMDISGLLGAGGGAARLAGAAGTADVLGGAAAATDPIAATLRAGGKVLTSTPVRAAAQGARNVGHAASGYLTAPVRSDTGIAGNALFEALGGDIGGGINALQKTRNMPTTPGYTPTMAERFAEGGVRNPTVAALQQRLPQNEVINRMVSGGEDVNLKAMQDQLARVNAQIQQQRTVLTPAALMDLQGMSQSLNAQIDAARTAGVTAGERVAARVPSTPLQAPGEVITEQAGKLKEEFKKTRVEPEYKAAISSAGNTQTPVSDVIAAAEDALGSLRVKVAGELGPSDTLKALTKLQSRATPEIPGSPAIYGETGLPIKAAVPATPGTPPTASLAELNDLRAAINKDIAAAKQSSDAGAATRAYNLQKLHGAIDEAVFGSKAFTDETKALYGKALETYRSEYAPRFKTGQTTRLFGQSGLGEQKLLPEDVVTKFLAKPTNAQQFVTTFGQDATASNAMAEGIATLYRRKLEKGGAAAGDEFLKANQSQLDILQKAGVNVRAQLQSVGRDMAQVEKGMTALEAKARLLKHTDAEALVTSMLKSPVRMEEGLMRLPAEGRAALVKEVLDRAGRQIDAGEPAAALDYLKTNERTIKAALKAKSPGTVNYVYQQAVDVAEAAVESAKVAKELPKAGDLSKVAVKLTQTYTPQQLTDLQLVAKDLARRNDVEVLAGRGTRAAAPSPGALATEGATTGPASLSVPISAAKEILKQLGKGVNKKAAAQLAHWMYKDPDAAIAALETVIANRASKAGKQVRNVELAKGARQVVTSPLAKIATSLNNAMASSNQNMMSEQQ